MNYKISEMDERKEQKELARKKRMTEAAAQLTVKYPEQLKEAEFNLQPNQHVGEDGSVPYSIIRKALGDHNLFRQVLRQGKERERLLLGLDSTVPGTPEVNDVDFDNPLNGHFNNFLVQPGKNGTNNQIQQLYKKVKQSEFPEPAKAKAEDKPSPKSAANPKPLPKPLCVPKQTSKDIKNPNSMDIGYIIKIMTDTGLPNTLTDIETPGKVPSSETFQFPQKTALQMPQGNKVDGKLDGDGGTCQKSNSSMKEEPCTEDNDSKNKFKKVGPDKSNRNSSKVVSAPKSKPSRKVSTSSSSGDDSSSDGSISPCSKGEKVAKKNCTTKKARSAINSPLVQNSPSKMRKGELSNNSGLNKENKINPDLSYDYSTDMVRQAPPISELNDFPYVQPQKDPELDESGHVDIRPSLSPMDIETISPLDPSNLFENLDFTSYNSSAELLPSLQSKSDNFGKASTENVPKNRSKQNTNDDFVEPSLDDSLDDSRNNSILNKQRKSNGVLYKKDCKSNSKLYKSNETKHISKSKTTRIESGPTVPTKAARKYIPEQRRKSVSDNSDKEENKARKLKDVPNKKNSEKSAKKEKLPKRDRLKAKMDVPKSTINVDISDDNTSDDEKAFLNVTSPTLTQHTTTTTTTSTTTTDLMPMLTKSTTCSIIQDQMPQPTNSVGPFPADFIPPLTAYPVDDNRFFNSMSTSFGTTLSPMNSPECHIKYQEPPTLMKEVKEEEMRPHSEISASDMSGEFKPPLHNLDELPPSATDNELVNVGLGDTIISSEETAIVNDIFSAQTHMNYSDIFSNSEPILLPELTNESSLLDHTQDILTETEPKLWLNDDLDSINDIETDPFDNRVMIPPIPQLSSNDVLNSEGMLNEKCLGPLTNFNDINSSKLTIKIPLHGIKLKSNKYQNRTSTCKDVDSSLSPFSDSFEVDVENDCSPLKRKRKKRHKVVEKLVGGGGGGGSGDTIKDIYKKVDSELAVPSRGENEKLIIRISLAKLKRPPLKGAVAIGDEISDGKGKLPKISRLNPEVLPSDVTGNEVEINEDIVVTEEAPVLLSNTAHTSLSSCPPVLLNSEEMKTEDGHQNDISQHESLPCSDKTTKKRRGRPPKEKVSKPEVKHRQTKHEMPAGKICDTADDVCHECGTLRKDYGRDSSRVSSYKNTYSAYYSEARVLKHRADNLKTAKERAHKYTEAVLKYVQYLIGLELSGKLNVIQAVEEYMQITSECITLVDYVVTHYGRKESQSYDVRFTLLCLRLQSILYLKLFKVKKDQAMKYSKVLSRYFKNFKAAGHTGPSPYPKPVHNRGSTGTPSPSSPSPGPSPGGSVASIGSAGSSTGSTGSNDITANGIGQYVSIPTGVHEKVFQHLQYSKNLLHGHLLWEDSESLTSHCQPFLIKLSRKAGQLTMQSSMLHVVDYVTAGLELICESPHS